jgi:hypothetical protein
MGYGKGNTPEGHVKQFLDMQGWVSGTSWRTCQCICLFPSKPAFFNAILQVLAGPLAFGWHRWHETFCLHATEEGALQFAAVLGAVVDHQELIFPAVGHSARDLHVTCFLEVRSSC